MTLKYVLKLLLIKTARTLVTVFRVFPIDRNKIVLSSFGGKQKSCNPLYISKSLQRLYPQRYRLIWVCQNDKSLKCTQDDRTKNGSILYIYHMLTAGCVITNDTLPSYLNFSKKQLVINTWHGGGLFKQTFGLSSRDDMEYTTNINYIHNSDINLYIISGKSWLEKVVRNRFGYQGEVLKCGMPRNDIFFIDNQPYIKKIKKYYNIPTDYKIVLYAPTFRGFSSNAQKGVLDSNPIDIESVKTSLKKKYGVNFCFIFRGHHLISKSLSGCINASDYPDMQELLASADVFISDYSSCLWDFSLTKRPAFIYAPDFADYSVKPGFESDYTEWPFLIAESNDQLCDLIESFDSTSYISNCNKYLMEYGSFENGDAADKVANYISSFLKK